MSNRGWAPQHINVGADNVCILTCAYIVCINLCVGLIVTCVFLAYFLAIGNRHELQRRLNNERIEVARKAFDTLKLPLIGKTILKKHFEVADLF